MTTRSNLESSKSFMRASATAERLNLQFRFIGSTSLPPATGSGDLLGVSAQALSATIPATRVPVFLMKSLLSMVVCSSPDLIRDYVVADLDQLAGSISFG